MDIWGNASTDYTAGLGFTSTHDEAKTSNKMRISVDKAKLTSMEWSTTAMALTLNEKGQIYLAASRTDDTARTAGAFTIKIRNAKVIEEITTYYAYDYSAANHSWWIDQSAIDFGSEYANKEVYVTLTICGNADPNKTASMGLWGYKSASEIGSLNAISREQLSTYQNWSKVTFKCQLDANGKWLISPGINASIYENFTIFVKDVEVYEYYTKTGASGWQGEFFTLDFSNDETVAAYDTIELQLDVYGIISKAGTSRIGFYYTKTLDSDSQYGDAKVCDGTDIDGAIRSGEWRTVTIKVKLDANRKVKISASRTQGDTALTPSDFELLVRNVKKVEQ